MFCLPVFYSYSVSIFLYIWYGYPWLPGPLSRKVKGPVLVNIKLKILLPGRARVITKKFYVALKEVRVLSCKIMRIAEKHLKITSRELPIILEYIRVPNG